LFLHGDWLAISKNMTCSTLRKNKTIIKN